MKWFGLHENYFLRFLVEPISKCIKFLDQHMFSSLQHIGVLVPYFFYCLSTKVVYTMPRLIEVLTRGLCHDISLGIVSMLCQSILELASSHANILATWVVGTVGFNTPPVVHTVGCVTAQAFCNLMVVPWGKPSHVGVLVQCIGAHFAWFVAPFPTFSLFPITFLPYFFRIWRLLLY